MRHVQSQLSGRQFYKAVVKDNNLLLTSQFIIIVIFIWAYMADFMGSSVFFQMFPETVRNNLEQKAIVLRVKNLAKPEKILENGKIWLKSITVSAGQLKFDHQVQDSNRILECLDSAKCLLMNFGDLLLEDKKRTCEYIEEVLKAGVVLNEERYHYVGQSNSQLKDRKCLLYCGTEEEIQKVLDGFGDWTLFKNVAKLAKRTGLLFSNGRKVFALPSEKYKIIDDIKKNGHCFTNGCGYISWDLIRRITKKMSLEFRDKRHYPSVVQIRYQGFKGILLLGTHLKNDSCEFRKSMNKFSYTGPDDFYVVDHAKPYTIGRLNNQIIILLSALGIEDDVFLKKQVEHYHRLEAMFTEMSIAFEYLLATGKVELAGELFERGFTEEVNRHLKEAYKHELKTSMKIKKRRTTEGPSHVNSEKIRILVEKSRVVFAAADPTKKLGENQCFFRPTINNQSTTVVGHIFCVRNPCYHAGDIVILEAVDIPECKDIVDVILFSVNGDCPTAHRSAGGDLDGDKFFVCWDEDLIPKKMAESYGYPPNLETPGRTIKRSDLIKHFATFSNSGVARCSDLFLRWAEAKGPRCLECTEINKLFSKAIDGDSVEIPRTLTKLPDVDEQIIQQRIWKKLVTIAEERRKKKFETESPFQMTMNSEELCTFLEEECTGASDYEVLCFLIRWSRYNYEDINEYLSHIDFSTFSNLEKINARLTKQVPPYLLLNALNSSRILSAEQMRHFNLDSRDQHWKRLHLYSEDNQSETCLVFDIWKSLSKFRRVFVAMEIDHKRIICLSFCGDFSAGSENDVDDRVEVYLYDKNEKINEKKRCSGGYKLRYDEGFLQIYEGDKTRTFVKLAVPQEVQRTSGSVISLNDLSIDSVISVALPRLSKDISNKSSRIQKTRITKSEIYVISNRDNVQTVREIANPDYSPVEEVVDVDRDYNPPDCTRPDNDGDAKLLSLSYTGTTGTKELEERMLCWVKYGLYDRVIESIQEHLKLNNSEFDLQRLINFSAVYPIFIAPLMEFISKSKPMSIASSDVAFIFGTCLKSACSVEDTIVLENSLKVLDWYGFLDIMDVVKIAKGLVVDHPYSEAALEYVFRLFDLLGNKRQFFEGFQSDAYSYFLKQIKMLCIQTLEELTSGKNTDSGKTSELKNRYKVRKFDNNPRRFTLFSEGSHLIRLRPGDVLTMTRLNTTKTERIAAIRAVVNDVDRGLVIDLAWVPRDIEVATWRVKQAGNIIGFRQSLDAIRRLLSHGNGSSSIVNILVNPKLSVGTLTDDDIPADISESKVNRSQYVAVKQAEKRLLTLWQGPAGTGKTTTIFYLIQKLLERINKPRILVTAATNTTVDNIALLAVGENIPVIRIGDKNSIHPNLHEITLEGKLDGSPKHFNSKKAEKLLKAANIIFATCVGCGTNLLEKFEFDFVIVDEASQVSEPICLIPLAKKCDHFLLVGDHKQLRPFCHERAAESQYSISLFERLDSESHHLYLLDTQYRMHSGISKFPNANFYDGRLKDGIRATDREPVPGFAWPNSNVPVAFVQVNGKETYAKGSKWNQAEVSRVSEVLEKIVGSGGVRCKHIGIISLYSAQVKKITEALKSIPQHAEMNEVEVNTADGFQGREKELILITCVRCNDIGKIGFLDDPRRFNVMLTRARRGLILFGDRKTLSTNEMWNNWFKWCDSEGLYCQGAE